MSKDNIQTETSNRKKMKPQELSVPTLHAAENQVQLTVSLPYSWSLCICRCHQPRWYSTIVSTLEKIPHISGHAVQTCIAQVSYIQIFRQKVKFELYNESSTNIIICS